MAVAKALGARRVIAVDINQERLDFAKSYAATDIYLPVRPLPLAPFLIFLHLFLRRLLSDSDVDGFYRSQRRYSSDLRPSELITGTQGRRRRCRNVLCPNRGEIMW